MGRIITSVTITNGSDPSKSIRCDALVDTGAAHMVLPSTWRERLGKLEKIREVELELANQTFTHGEVCGPVKIQLEGFYPVFSEVLFLEMHPVQETYEPLVGYIVLEQSQAAVDMLGHRLLPVKAVDLK